MRRDVDAPLITIACNDPESQKWLPLLTPYTIDHATWYFNEYAVKAQTTRSGILFAIEQNNTFVGCIDIKRVE